MFGYSGIDLDPYAARGNRAQNVTVLNRATGAWEPLDQRRERAQAGGERHPILSETGEKLDATEVIADHLKTRPARPELNRVRLLAPLPEPVYGNREIQPLQGVPTIR